MGIVVAIIAEVALVVKLVATCFGRFGLAGCVCQMALTLQPLWRRVSTSREVRCENGDPFPLLMNRIFDMIQQGAENLLNAALIDPINNFFDSLPWPLDGIGRPIPRACWSTAYNPYRCVGGPRTPAEQWALAQCEDASRGLEEMCYYARISHICTNDDMLNEYTSLFASGYQRVDDVMADFSDAFGETYAFMDPTMQALFKAVEQSSFSGPDLTRRKDICSSQSFISAMTLDMIIVSCIFAVMEQACPDDAEPDENFAFMVESATFSLPRVRFFWDAGVSRLLRRRSWPPTIPLCPWIPTASRWCVPGWRRCSRDCRTSPPRAWGPPWELTLPTSR